MKQSTAQGRAQLREITEALIAMLIVIGAIYAALFKGTESGPVVDWAGIIIGVYFGAQITARVANGGNAIPLRPPNDKGER